MNCITVEKGRHQYVFRYRQGQECDILEAVAQMASDPAEAFDWADAATVSFQVTFEQANSCLKAIAPNLDNQAA